MQVEGLEVFSHKLTFFWEKVWSFAKRLFDTFELSVNILVSGWEIRKNTQSFFKGLQPKET